MVASPEYRLVSAKSFKVVPFEVVKLQGSTWK